MQKSRIVKKNFDSCHHGGKYSASNHQIVKIDFSSNINPLGISQKVIESLKENIEISSVYPDPNCIKLKKDILEYLDSDIDSIENLIIGNGATELIHYFSSAFAKRQVLIPSPTFCEYELAARRNNADIIDAPYKKNFEIDEELVIKKINNPDSQIKSMFICNPNNPTGKNSRKQIIEILEKNNNKGMTIMLDESYI
jgi:threonine-phosphate decarboxylase